MKTFLLLSTLLIFILFARKTILFLRYKSHVNRNHIFQIKLKNYTSISWIFLISGLINIIVGWVFYLSQDSIYLLIFWGFLAFVQIINFFITPQYYLLVNSKGIRKSYDSKLLLWDKITSIKKSEKYSNELLVKIGKKSKSINYGDEVYLENLALLVNNLRKDIFDKYFKNL